MFITVLDSNLLIKGLVEIFFVSATEERIGV